MRSLILAGFATSALFVGACGDKDSSSLACGAGTFEYMGECVPYDPNDTDAPVTTITPDGGQLPTTASVRLETSEPATIYYTLDGTDPTTSSASGVGSVLLPGLDVQAGDVTVKFFAVDPAGNAEAVKSALFTLDVAPAPVSDLQVSISEAGAAVSWTPPTDSDYEGVVVARVRGPIVGPANGNFYAAGAVFGPGIEVVYAGTDTSFTDSTVAPGYARYAVWARDVWNSYSNVRAAGAQVALPPQTATITVDVAATTATVSQSPSLLGLSVGEVTYNAAGSFVRLPLQITNQTSRVLFNLKAVATSVTGGFLGNADGSLATGSYRYVTSGSGVGATHSPLLQINGVAADATVTIELTFANDPLLIGPSTWAQPADQGSSAQLYDLGAKRRLPTYLPEIGNMIGPNGVDKYAASILGGSISPDGRWMYVSGRQSSAVVAVDLTTHQPILRSALLTSGKGHGLWPRLSEKRNVLYVVVNDGVHAYRAPRTPTGAHRFFLVALNASTLAEISRVELPSAFGAKNSARARTFTLSPDSDTAAIGIMSGDSGYDTGELFFVDLDTMTVIDTDASTSGTQPVTVADSSDLEYSPDGTKVYVAPVFKVGGDLQVVDLSDYSVDRITVPLSGMQMTFGPDGRLYMGGPTGTEMWVHTPGETTATKLDNYALALGAIEFAPDGTMWCQPGLDSDDLVEVETADGAVTTTIDGDGRVHGGGHWLAVTPF